MATLKLTDKAIQALKPRAERYEIVDPDFIGGSFAVRVTPNGAKSFSLRYRNTQGQMHRVTLGDYPVLSLADARARGRALCGQVQQGRDPVAERKAQRLAETFEELFKVYLERHAKANKRSWEEDQRKGERDILPYLGAKKAKDITRADIIEVVDRVVDRGSGVCANRVRSLLSKVFAFGISRGLVEHNPARDVPKPTKETARSRVLTQDELRAVWQAICKEAPLTAATFKLRLITGQRGVEVASMRWREIEAGTWTIPAEISKNGMAHKVPLTFMALDVLREIEGISGNSEWVFPSPTGCGHFGTLNKARERIQKWSGLKNFTPHDLRRCCATYMATAGVPRLVIAKVLNHSERGITAIYDRSGYEREKREALELWAKTLQGILDGGKEANVLAYKTASK
ncbi:MAG: tyrosine-type recombinase/integrase [Candidatus Hydrogenedentes bacterium]|nr:tyrosine-type recombinase/integrase [Candidatus Hydrogenedentota bacterium]